MRIVELPQGVLEYDDRGDGPPVVLLHGPLMDHTVWNRVLPLLSAGFRYVRSVLPFGAHRRPLRPDADLTPDGQVALVADFLDALDLRDVTLVHSDWGGSLFLTTRGRDARVARTVILPCEAFDNFPPGLPGRLLTLAVAIPGGLRPAPWPMRVPVAARPAAVVGMDGPPPDPGRDDARLDRAAAAGPGHPSGPARLLRSRFDPVALVRDTEALRRFGRDALVLWSPENRVMPPEHGRRLAELLPRGRLPEIPDASVLSMMDAPVAVAREIGTYLRLTG